MLTAQERGDLAYKAPELFSHSDLFRLIARYEMTLRVVEGRADLATSGLSEVKLILDADESDTFDQVRRAWSSVAETLTALREVSCQCGHWAGEHDDYPEGGPCLVAGCECDAMARP